MVDEGMPRPIYIYALAAIAGVMALAVGSMLAIVLHSMADDLLLPPFVADVLFFAFVALVAWLLAKLRPQQQGK